MAEEIVLKVDVELEQGAKSLRTLKQEFKDTQKELDGAVIGSQKYYATLKKLGDLKGDMGDLNATINAFDGENKIAVGRPILSTLSVQLSLLGLHQLIKRIGLMQLCLN